MIWRTHFERHNFDFRPQLTQSADVVFETDIPFNNNDGNPEKFERAAWDAMWEQNPHWKDSRGPIANSKGWSSVFGGNTFKEVG